MKKLKYLLFIIPLLFIFIGNIRAYDILSCGDIKITEETLLSDFSTNFSEENISDYPYLACYKHATQNLQCYFMPQSVYNVISFNRFQGSSSNGVYFFFTSFVSDSYSLFLSYNYSNCSFVSSSIESTVELRFYIPKVDNQRFFVSNFDNSLINSSLGNDFYTYNLLNLSNEEPEPEPEEPTIENKIYLPDELQDGNCPIILNKDTIRVYEETPQANVSVNFTDYFINSHYIKQTGTETLTDTISCLNLEDFSTSYVYRFDFDKILIIFGIFTFFIAYPVMKIIHAFFVGFKRR